MVSLICGKKQNNQNRQWPIKINSDNHPTAWRGLAECWGSGGNISIQMEGVAHEYIMPQTSIFSNHTKNLYKKDFF